MPKQFNTDLLKRLNRVKEVEIETQSITSDVKHRTIIWVIVEDGNVYIRSVRGNAGRWYKEIMVNPNAALLTEGEHIPVHAVPAKDEHSINLVSKGILQKYGQSPSAKAMVRDEVLPTTLRLEPI